MTRLFWLPLVFCLSLGPLEAQVRVSVEPQQGDETGPASRLNEIVAVAQGQGLLTLATPTNGAQEWRYRTIRLHLADTQPIRIGLSRSGTKALVEFERGHKVVDLSRPTYSVSQNEPEPPPSHRLLRQVFPVIREGRLEVLDDLGDPHTDYGPIDDVIAAAAHDDGSILYATPAGSLFLLRPSQPSPIELGYELAPGTTASDVHIVGGTEENPHRFLLVLRDGEAWKIVDPFGGASVASARDKAAAIVRANLVLLRDADTTDDEIHALLARLIAPEDDVWFGVPQARDALKAMDWSFVHVVPDVSLYAPILEIAGQERVFPSSVGIWEALRGRLDVSLGAHSGPDEDEEVDAYLRAYLRMGEARKAECTLYQRVSSYSGSWLIEYWIYYPFDVGGLEPHAHDSEHLFVEVDKLGGTIAALFGGAHGMLAPNNTYLILDDKGYPLELPLFAIVELGKHATAPDVNRDGVFTPGLDENYFKESAKVWGVRDAFGTKDSHFLLYDASMMAPRQRDDWLGVAGAYRLFPGVALSSGQSLCRVAPFREEIEGGTFGHERSREAAEILKNHEDARDTRTIFKPWVFPRSFVRAGAGNDRDMGFPALQVAYVTDLDRIPYVDILPGRLALELAYAPWSEPQRLDFGARYERLVSNLFGFYAGIHQGFEISDSNDFNRQDGIWYSVGPMVEVPLWKTNVLVQFGGAFREGSSPIFEFRVAFGIYQPKRWFWGIKNDQKTPY